MYTWTKNKPIKSGFYFVRNAETKREERVEYFTAHTPYEEVPINCEFAGPVPKPTEPEVKP